MPEVKNKAIKIYNFFMALGLFHYTYYLLPPERWVDLDGLTDLLVPVEREGETDVLRVGVLW